MSESQAVRYTAITKAFAKVRGVEVRPGWGAGNLVLALSSKMFVLLMAHGFVAKLPKARVDDHVAAGMGTRFDPRKNGRVMKEWLVADVSADWLELAREAHVFAKQLPRTPTKARRPLTSRTRR